MNRFALVSFALLSTTATGCIFGVDTSPLCDDSEPNCENGVWVFDTDIDAEDVGDVDDVDLDVDITPDTPDADVDPDTDTDLPPELTLEISGEEGPFILDPDTGSVTFGVECAPQGCTLDACTLSYEGGEVVTPVECAESIELPTAKLNAEGSWTLTVNASLDEQSTSASKTFDVRYAFEAGLEGYEAGESYAFSHPPTLESFCTRDGCDLTIACTDAGGGTLACEGLAFPEGEAEVVITLNACA
ncbi:hypothetical protein DL240_19210, partial [Lujinxingia litoralis]